MYIHDYMQTRWMCETLTGALNANTNDNKTFTFSKYIDAFFVSFVGTYIMAFSVNKIHLFGKH